MKKSLLHLQKLSIVLSISAIAHLANAQSTWTGADLVNNNTNWSDANNWSGGAPSSGAGIFHDGAFPITTNTIGAVNNIVQSSTAITSLTYNNTTAGDYYTTLIPSGSILMVSGNMTFGPVNGTGAGDTVTITGAGSLSGGGGRGAFSMNCSSGTETVDLSGLTNFVFNIGGSSSGSFSVAGSASSSGILKL